MRNHQWDRNHNTNTRPLPSCLPEYIPVEIWRSEFKGREQWIAKYKVYNNGKDSDWVDFVVNFGRFQRGNNYHDGDVLWVRPTAMAPQKRLIFAECVQRGDPWDLDSEPFPYRVGQEFECIFRHTHQFSDMYEEYWDNWVIQLKTSVKLEHNETVRVRVTSVPDLFEVKVELVGYEDKRRGVQAPPQICYLEVKSLEGPAFNIEGDVVAYTPPSRYGYGATLGDTFETVVETADDVFVLKCQHLRHKWYGRDIISTVTQSGREYGQLCELVWIEGEPTSDRAVFDFEHERRRTKPTASELRDDELRREEEMDRQREEWAQIDADYEAEVRYNSERPDYD